MSLAQYLSAAGSAQKRGDGRALAEYLAPYSVAFDQVQQILNSAHIHKKELNKQALQYTDNNDLFANFLVAYLLFCKGAYSPDIDDYQEANTSFDLLVVAYGQAVQLLARSPEAGWFVPSLRYLTEWLVALAFRADSLSHDPNQPKCGDAARLLTRALGAAAADRSTEGGTKGDAILFLANETFKIYFHLNNLRLCDTVVTNTRSSGPRLQHYPKADQVAFAYYMGRIHLFQRRLRKAVAELSSAFSMCTNKHKKNKRLILIYLITALLPLGSFPTAHLLASYDLSNQYLPLISHLKDGNYRALLSHLDDWQDWHVGKGTYLILREKLEVLCWRNLIRKTLWITDRPNVDSKRPPVLKLDNLLKTALVAFNEPTLDLDDVECMCISLIDQGYLKGYIQHSTGQLVLARTPPSFGFPPIASVQLISD